MLIWNIILLEFKMWSVFKRVKNNSSHREAKSIFQAQRNSKVPKNILPYPIPLNLMVHTLSINDTFEPYDEPEDNHNQESRDSGIICNEIVYQ